MRQRPKSLEFLEVLCGALRKIGLKGRLDGARGAVWQKRLAKDGAVEEGGNRDLGRWIVRALSVADCILQLFKLNGSIEKAC